MSDDLRARMRAVFRPKDCFAKLSDRAKAPLRRYNVDSVKESAVTDGPECNGVLSNQINVVTSVTAVLTNRDSQPEKLCVRCGAGGDLWHLDTPTEPVAVHEECARFLPKPEPAEPTAAYQAVTAQLDGHACRVEIVELPAAGRYRKVFGLLQTKPPELVPVERWRQCIEDGSRFLAKWGEQAESLGWSSADLFGLAPFPDKPHPSYNRMSRYDQVGLIWLLEGREVVALTADTATIRNPSSGTVTTYRRRNKPSYGPPGDSLDDLK
jgi:hypothetical protein